MASENIQGCDQISAQNCRFSHLWDLSWKPIKSACVYLKVNKSWGRVVYNLNSRYTWYIYALWRMGYLAIQVVTSLSMWLCTAGKQSSVLQNFYCLQFWFESLQLTWKPMQEWMVLMMNVTIHHEPYRDFYFSWLISDIIVMSLFHHYGHSSILLNYDIIITL